MSVSSDSRFHSRSVVTNIIWKFLERGSSVIVSLLVNVFLARLLDPSAHGLLAMVTVFVTFTEVFVTTGLGNALIQKQNADALDFSSIFWLNVAISLLLYLVLFFSAPWIARFLGYQELVPILRVLSLRLIVSAVNSVQCAYISRNMLFRHYFFSTLSGKIFSGMIGILLALAGVGVWALVAQSLSIIIIETAVLWVRVKWRPALQFSWKCGMQLYGFACKVMLTSIVELLAEQVRTMLIGKHYTSDALAYYNKGSLFPNTMTTNITSALSAVMYPVLASKQTVLSAVKNTCRQWISMFGYAVFPLLTGMATVSDLFIPLLLGDKWMPSVPFLQIACGMYAAWIVEVPIREAIKSTGKASVCLWMQLIKAFCSLLSLLLVYKQGVHAIAVAALLCAGINVVISIVYGWKYLKYTFREVVSDLVPTILLCLVMAVSIWGVKQLITHRLLCLLIQVLTGILVYIAVSALTRNKNFYSCLNMLKKLV